MAKVRLRLANCCSQAYRRRDVNREFMGLDEAIAFRIQKCLVSLLTDKPSSEKDLSTYLHGRFRIQIERMSLHLPQLQGDDAVESQLNKAVTKVTQALKRTKPDSIASLLEVTASEMRQTLAILARDGVADRPKVDPFETQLQPTKSIVDGALTSVERRRPSADTNITWSAFHVAADRLPAEERTMVDLLYYHQMTRTEVIDLLAISEVELNRRWLSARRMILRGMDASCQTTA